MDDPDYEVARPSDRLSASDGTELALYRWKPGGAPRAIILLVHGHGEHMGRYSHVASLLAAHGLDVHGYDLRGHGHSGGKRVYVDRFVRYIDDTYLVARHVLAQAPTLPLILFGHSMGGLIVLHFSLRHAPMVSGTLISSPFIIPAMPIPRPLLAFSSVISRLLPWLPTLDVAARPLTHDPEMRMRKDADPLMYQGRVLARTGNEMRMAGDRLLAEAAGLQVPLYIFHGTEDHLADWKGALTVYSRAGSDHKSLTLYNGLYHETMNEIRRDRVLAAVLEWIEGDLLHAIERSA